MRTLVWFRRDLRVTDNRALHDAARHSEDGLLGLFVITPKQWSIHNDAPSKIKFWLESLAALSSELAKRNIPLRIETSASFRDVPATIVNVAKQYDCQSVYWNREYEVNERFRDGEVAAALNQEEIAVRRFHDRIIVPPAKIATQEGKFYSVFTPYRKVWQRKAVEHIDVVPAPRKQSSTNIEPSQVPQQVAGFDLSEHRDDLWKAGESEAQKRLRRFCNKIDCYHDARNEPSISGTSGLSPYLAAGVISPRQCLAAAVAANDGHFSGDGGAATWISELAWRDFYVHVLVGFPRVSKHQPFKEKTDALKWRTCESDFHAWKVGQTGYPMVDAGMRQLNQTGWMHNRLRMVTAMFLTKNLLIDWRLGERYFMQQLVDGDLAANNGGWQWSASTGTDSVPYFRIFNPFSQSKRFDPQGTFIKEMCPELADVPASSLHDPGKLTAAIKEQGIEYADFVVDYKKSRERCLQAFKSIK